MFFQGLAPLGVQRRVFVRAAHQYVIHPVAILHLQQAPAMIGIQMGQGHQVQASVHW